MDLSSFTTSVFESITTTERRDSRCSDRTCEDLNFCDLDCESDSAMMELIVNHFVKHPSQFQKFKDVVQQDEPQVASYYKICCHRAALRDTTDTLHILKNNPQFSEHVTSDFATLKGFLVESAVDNPFVHIYQSIQAEGPVLSESEADENEEMEDSIDCDEAEELELDDDADAEWVAGMEKDLKVLLYERLTEQHVGAIGLACCRDPSLLTQLEEAIEAGHLPDAS